jgi:alcohol dehydrogenase class IV
MVESFQFSRLPQIHFGAGKLSLLPALIRRTGSGVLLVTGKQSFTGSASGSRLLEKLNEEKLNIDHYVIPGEPSPGMIDNVVNNTDEKRIDVVVSIGGGSVIDAGKAISAMLPLKKSVKDFLEGVGTQQHPGTKIPFIAVPTTSGTGSEATKNSVISETGKNGFKKSLRHDNFVPDTALVDPELTVSCSPGITAASGMDCLTQITEAYLSDKSSGYTDALAVEGLKAVKSSLYQAYLNPDDIGARTGMSFAALTSGICLANAGLGAVHGFASSVGALFDIPHGVVCGTLMAVANELNVRVLRKARSNDAALDKYASLGKLFLEDKKGNKDFYIDGFISYLHELTEKLQLPSLKKYGIDDRTIDQLCSDTDIKNNPVLLNHDDLVEILTRRVY